MLFRQTLVNPLLLYYIYKNAYIYSTTIFPENHLSDGFTYHEVIKQTPINKIYISLYFGIRASINEEFYYRFLLLKFLQRTRTQLIIYFLISPFLFSIIHWESGVRNIFSTFIFGASCSLLYYFHRNIWPLLLGHCVGNFYIFSTAVY